MRYIINIFFMIIFLFKIKGYKQNITVKGRILCKGIPLQYLKIQLKENDFFYDDILDKSETNEDGKFMLSGYDDEYLPITPYIQFVYKCCELFEDCQIDTKVLNIPSMVSYHDFGDIDYHKL
uniref:Transthyretin-like family-containing protein n=1 Tax=Parastrongyloides trichosuri TaxID=131310 RepID=A0A0N5A193_PARTI